MSGLGLDVQCFEQGVRLGGHWNGDKPRSGIWPVLTTNTSREITCFNDLAYDVGTPMFPAAQQVQHYLERYATKFGLDGSIQFGHRLELLERKQDHWSLTFSTADGWHNWRHARVSIMVEARAWVPYCIGVEMKSMRKASLGDSDC